MSAGLRNFDGRLEEQSRVCGSGPGRTLWKVVLPGLAPNIGATVLLMAWYGLAMFAVPVIIGTGARIDVLSVQIVRLLRFTYPPQTALAVGLSSFVMITLAILWLLQRRLLASGHYVTVGGRAAPSTRTRLGWWRGPARVLMIGYLFIAAVLPLAALVTVSLNGFWSADIVWSNLSLRSFVALFQDHLTQRSIANSLILAGVGATIGIGAAAIVSLMVKQSASRVAAVVDGMVKLPAAVSSIVLALGFILAFAGPPFELGGTVIILLLAYVTHFMPQASVAADTAAGQLGHELTEASHVSGAGGWRTFHKVSLPIMFPGLAAGWALLFVFITGDLTSSAMLAGPGNPVVGFRLLEIFDSGSFPALASLATLLTFITSAVLAIVLPLARRGAHIGLGQGGV
jgi:iron(III) transport system permease protein